MKKGYKRKSYEHRKDLAGEYRWGDIFQLIFVAIFLIGMTLDLLFFNFSSSWQNIFPWYYRVIVFIFIFFVAGYFAQKSHKKIFGEKRKGLMVVKTGVYSRLRHPMYFGAILTYLSFVIISLSVVALLIFFVVFIFYYYLCYCEEQILLDKLGDEYKEYMKNVPMLIPSFRKKL
jgi:protein-S-isoprenylcysteine O-methyltransferase Ste14